VVCFKQNDSEIKAIRSMSMNRVRWYGPTLALAIVAAAVTLAGPRVVQTIAWAQQDAKINTIKDSLTATPALAELSKAFRNVAEVVEPSVVYISVAKRNVQNSGGMGGGPQGMPRNEDDLRRWFFGPRQPGSQQPGRQQPNDEEGDAPEGMPNARPQGKGEDYGKYDVPTPYANGSGWVYDKAGHIITNNHVIEDADVITVRFFDGTERTATVKGRDPKTDIAVLKVDDTNLHPATIAKEVVQQGDIVFAFGSPFRFDFSMSQGIVSAKGRQLGILNGRQGYENFIQTDAAINPGNSGGPLTNIYGQVVGMNTAIASRTGSFNGLGFAIPSDMVVEISDQIIKSGKVARGYLGVYIDDLDPKMAKTFNYTGKGVLVIEPIANGPGAKAGVQRGDIITKVAGQAVESADQLRNRVARATPGSKIDLEVFRAGKTVTLNMIVEAQPEQITDASGSGGPAANPNPESKESQVLRKLGIEAADITGPPGNPGNPGRNNNNAGPNAQQSGVAIVGVRPGSAAAAAGLSPRAVITEVQGTPVKSIAELTTELAKYDLKQGVRLSVRFGNVVRFVVLELPRD
jgi:serine protease Do